MKMFKFSVIAIFGMLFATVFTLPLEKTTERKNVGEYGDYFEGDMILDDEQMEILFSPARNGLIDTKYRWPNKTLIYQLSDAHTKEQNDFIEAALKVLESVSCVRFKRRTNEEKYVEITAEDSGCHSLVGYKDKVQKLNLQKGELGKDCFRQGSVIHEFLHALGFYHMHASYDRDDYVRIRWNNIIPWMTSDFMKYTNYEVTHFNTTYDYGSLMHYSAYAFSDNGLPTIEPLDESKLKTIGQRDKLSEKDIYKLNAMYKCDKFQL